MSRAVDLFVAGRPAPQGSKRHVGGGRMVESSRAVGPWREAVRAETAAVFPQPWSGPVRVFAEFFLPRPKGHYGTGRNAGTVKASAPRRPAGKPDLDKLLRAVLDGLKEGGAFRDDAQVVSITVRKLYATGACGADLRVVEISDGEGM